MREKGKQTFRCRNNRQRAINRIYSYYICTATSPSSSTLSWGVVCSRFAMLRNNNNAHTIIRSGDTQRTRRPNERRTITRRTTPRWLATTQRLRFHPNYYANAPRENAAPCLYYYIASRDEPDDAKQFRRADPYRVFGSAWASVTFGIRE